MRLQACFPLVLAPLVLLCACGGAAPPPAGEPKAEAALTPPPAPTSAATTQAGGSTAPRTLEVPIAAKSGSKLTGKATFAEVEGGVKVTVQVAGATPGKLATHVHEMGDCSAPDAKSAGEHFNPAHQPHGLPGAAERHLGDLGNIEIKADGTGSTDLVVKGATLKDGEPSSYIGRAIIVHEKVDDGGQPSGNAGARIGCGVIK